jgi:hypothetical protein
VIILIHSDPCWCRFGNLGTYPIDRVLRHQVTRSLEFRLDALPPFVGYLAPLLEGVDPKKWGFRVLLGGFIFGL